MSQSDSQEVPTSSSIPEDVISVAQLKNGTVRRIRKLSQKNLLAKSSHTLLSKTEDPIGSQDEKKEHRKSKVCVIM